MSAAGPRTPRRRHGSSRGEHLILLALAALFIAVVAAAFARSTARGLALVGLAGGAALLVLAFGILRDRRMERRRFERVRAALEEAVADLGEPLAATFFGSAHAGPAAFAVAAAARTLVYVRENQPRASVTGLEFDRLAAAFARPDGPERYRLEARPRRGGERVGAEPPFVVVPRREDAERWVAAMRVHLGERARMVDGGRAPGGA